MRVTKEIQDAIKRACDSYGYGGQSRFAERTGVSQSYISRYINGKTTEMKSDVWEKLEPHIRPYIQIIQTNHGSNVSQSVGKPEGADVTSEDIYFLVISKKFPQLSELNKVHVLKYVEELLETQK
jgi:predicted transcriptional regulator